MVASRFMGSRAGAGWTCFGLMCALSACFVFHHAPTLVGAHVVLSNNTYCYDVVVAANTTMPVRCLVLSAGSTLVHLLRFALKSRHAGLPVPSGYLQEVR